MTQSTQMLTADTAQHTARRLNAADDLLVHTLAGHISKAYGNSLADFAKVGLNRCNNLRQHAKEISTALGADSSIPTSAQREPIWLKEIVKAYEKVMQKNSLEPYTSLLKKTFDQDACMPVEMAWIALLVDGVEGIVALQPETPALNKTVAAPTRHRMAA